MTQPSAKPSLVLLSGLLCDHTMWQDIAEQLSSSFDVSIFSFAGYNSLTDMAEHVLAEAPAHFALAGHSMGGRVALEVYRLAPERITHLALLNTGVHPKRESEVPGRMRLLELADTQGMQAVADSWLPPMMSETGKQNIALMNDLKAMILRHTPQDFHGQISALLNRPDAEAVLSLVNVPTLLLSGDEDQWSPVSQHEAIQQKISGSQLVAVPAGHMSTVEIPAAISTIFRKWLKPVEAC